MTCRIIAKFDNTESAQAAARAIQEKANKISGLRLQYNQDIPDRIYINTINYTMNGIMMQPVVPLYEYPSINAWPYGTANIFGLEVSEECGIEIYADSDSIHCIRQLILNNGGYNTIIQENPL